MNAENRQDSVKMEEEHVGVLYKIQVELLGDLVSVARNLLISLKRVQI